jgi:hypothetical protein
MNDLQKKLFIVGIVAFIVWFLIGYENSSVTFSVSGLNHFWHINNFTDIIEYFITDSWYQIVLFITWLGSLIAFNIYKD